MKPTKPGTKYKVLIVPLTASQYKLIVKAAGGEDKVEAFVLTAALNAAKEVISEGV